jgi:hypothetical protein
VSVDLAQVVMLATIATMAGRTIAYWRRTGRWR